MYDMRYPLTCDKFEGFFDYVTSHPLFPIIDVTDEWTMPIDSLKNDQK